MEQRDTLDTSKINAEISKLMAETMRINQEATKIEQEARWYPLIALAAIVGAAAALAKMFV